MENTKRMDNSGLLSDNDILESIDNSELVICPFHEKNLTPLGYNLSFTKFIFSTKNKLLYNIKTDKKTNEIYCIVEPNDTLLILTQEAVWVSKKLAGTFHSKVGIVSKGFGHISTTLDPNWEGPLLISLNNPTKQKIKLVIGKDKKDGIEYKTFVTLIFYRMISKAKGNQDNLPCRVEILKDTEDNLKDSKKYSQLISVIDKIRNFETLHVGIGAVGEEFRKEKIKQFKDKYNRFAVDINGYIGEASRISKSIVDDNYFKYSIVIFIIILVVLALIIFSFKAYRKNDSNLLAFLAIITAVVVIIIERVEKYAREKLL